MTWENRIVGYSDEDPAILIPSPQNWRLHGQAQEEALNGVLTEVGFVQNVICNRVTGHIVDGHLRVSMALKNGQPFVPVTWVELTPEEEALVLASLDPIAAMAESDNNQLNALLHEVQSGDAGVQAMLAELAEQEGITPPAFEPVSVDDQPRLDQKSPVVCPECGHEFVPS